MKMRTTISLFFGVLLLLFVSSAMARNGLNPDAPPETGQFSFIIGTWHCKTRFMTPDGTISEGEATWIGQWALDGWAIKDDWFSTGPDGKPFQGFNIRSFNPKTRKWDNRWLPQVTLQWRYYESEMVGDTMVMTGGAGKDANGAFTDRITFYNISENSWSWRKDRSYDGGKTWNEGVGFIEATRVEP